LHCARAAAAALLNVVAIPTAVATAGHHHPAHISAPKATKLLVTAPKTAKRGAKIHVTVTALTKAGRRARSFRGTVRFSSSAKKAQLPKSYRFRKTDAGRRTFTGVSFPAAGHWTITVRDHRHQTIIGRAAVHVLTPPRTTDRTTRTRLVCMPTGGLPHVPASCTAYVTDSDLGAQTTPRGTVAFAASVAGTFSAGGACTLPGSGTNGCAVTFAPAAVGTGTATVTARYTSSNLIHAASSGHESLGVCVVARWVVDSARGSDSASGDGCDQSFKTISKALSVASYGDTIDVQPGMYDTASGEVFPLVVPAGVSFVANQGVRPPTIDGNFLMPNSHAQLGQMVVDGDVTVTGASVTLDAMTIEHGSTCVSANASATTIIGVEIDHCATGIAVHGSGSVSITNSALLDSTVNLLVKDAATVDLSGGGNQLSCSTHADLEAASTVGIDAANTAWDHNPPTEATTGGASGGIDIYSSGTGGVTTTGASVVASPCA
jgi:Protein of unknown function (DUF1565)